jgi:hypothetical protein
MVPAQNTKYALAIYPTGLKNNTSWTAIAIDTAGYDYCQIVWMLGDNDIAMKVLAVQESATSGGSYASITGLVVATSSNINGDTSALQSATDDNTIQAFDIDLRGRKRFLKLLATNNNGSQGGHGNALAILSRAEEAATTVAQRGADEVLRV